VTVTLWVVQRLLASQRSVQFVASTMTRFRFIRAAAWSLPKTEARRLESFLRR